MQPEVLTVHSLSALFSAANEFVFQAQPYWPFCPKAKAAQAFRLQTTILQSPAPDLASHSSNARVSAPLWVS